MGDRYHGPLMGLLLSESLIDLMQGTNNAVDNVMAVIESEEQAVKDTRIAQILEDLTDRSLCELLAIWGETTRAKNGAVVPGVSL
jgi:hypothetical protein